LEWAKYALRDVFPKAAVAFHATTTRSTHGKFGAPGCVPESKTISGAVLAGEPLAALAGHISRRVRRIERASQAR
jgi:hypothetical protein